MNPPEIAWVASRVARPAHDLARAVPFYRDLLGLAVTGSFRDHDGYDGVFFALPGGGELELTTGPAHPDGWSAEDLLVLYLDAAADVAAIAALLASRGVPEVPAENPYWGRTGRTFLDPDGYRVVIAVRDRGPSPRIEWHEGSRTELRTLFEYAEDSPQVLAGYLDLGQVLVARVDSTPVGHLQLVPTATPGVIELKNMAVVPDRRGTGVGRALVQEALRLSAGEGWTRMDVATAAADIGNLRFYQRLGFRLCAVEPDAFTPATGYPEPIMIDGIPLLDRVRLFQNLPSGVPGG